MGEFWQFFVSGDSLSGERRNDLNVCVVWFV